MLFSLAALMASVLAPPAKAAAPAAEIERDAAGLWFMGVITDASARELIGQLRHDDVLIVNSPGGESAAALEIGRAIVDRGVAVTVNAQCFSACALYVFLPAKVRRINPGAYVWFHNTPALWLRASKMKTDIIEKQDVEEISNKYRSSENLLRSVGVDPAIMTCIDAATEPNLSSMAKSTKTPDSQLVGKPLPAIELRYNFVSLAPGVLAAFGAGAVIEPEFEANAPSADHLSRFFGVRLKQVTKVASCS